ncbi:MAG: efflux RND transporter periplasmic adaptor subunit [Planctomycetota bacterium]
MIQSIIRFIRWLVVVGGIGAAVAVAAMLRDQWLPMLALAPAPSMAAAGSAGGAAAAERDVLELSPQARKNLGVVSRPAALADYRRTILVPGEITDRPGISDRGVTSPAIGIVTQVHAFPGDTVRPGDKLFTLRLLSEYVQNAEAELFKAVRETELEQEKRARLAQIGEGTIAGARLIEIDQQLRRLAAEITSRRQELLARGLLPEQISEVEAGRFVTTVEIGAPPPLAVARQDADPVYEVQELKAELGTQVQAGQLLAVLSNHRLLYAVGHAFKREAPALERAAREGWPVEIEFAEDDPAAWPPLGQTFAIRHLANMVDRQSRTFDFFVPLENQSRGYAKDGRSFTVWRFRPGQRVRLHVPVEELRGVIVLPAEAVVRATGEAYVFRQNGNLFDRLPVHVLHEDRRHVVIANDGSVAPGWYLAQGAAASLNRVLEAQSASGAPVGMHVHADGTVHGAH